VLPDPEAFSQPRKLGKAAASLWAEVRAGQATTNVQRGVVRQLAPRRRDATDRESFCEETMRSTKELDLKERPPSRRPTALARNDTAGKRACGSFKKLLHLQRNANEAAASNSAGCAKARTVPLRCDPGHHDVDATPFSSFALPGVAAAQRWELTRRRCAEIASYGESTPTCKASPPSWTLSESQRTPPTGASHKQLPRCGPKAAASPAVTPACSKQVFSRAASRPHVGSLLRARASPAPCPATVSSATRSVANIEGGAQADKGFSQRV